MSARRAGILLHPTSLPGRFGSGDLGPEVDHFLDWAARAGQRVWQILPLGPVAAHGCPYDGLSAFAGNPWLISPESLRDDGLLTPQDLESVPDFPAQTVAFAEVAQVKELLLRGAFARFKSSAAPPLADALASFCAAPEQQVWLADWALFAALKARFNQRPWHTWDRSLKEREPQALDRARQELAPELDYQCFVQFCFFRQWQRVRTAAAERGIQLLGDLPIYVAWDSADVWAHRELFDLDDADQPMAVAGVPPDYFSPTGQLWGNPLYCWDRIAATGFAWWVDRLRANLRWTDVVRLDHFRGFAAYWRIPRGEATAVNGGWHPGPGRALFTALAQTLGPLPLLAEDLGEITPDVHALRDELGLPGMRILQFGFADPGSPHAIHHLTPKTVVYSGTHDNNTLLGWFQGLSPDAQQQACDYTGASAAEVPWAILRLAYTSVSELAILPVQDLLGLDGSARMNTPGVTTGNWGWRLLAGALTDDLADRLAHLVALSDRRG